MTSQIVVHLGRSLFFCTSSSLHDVLRVRSRGERAKVPGTLAVAATARHERCIRRRGGTWEACRAHGSVPRLAMSCMDSTRKNVRRNPFLLGYARRELDLSPACHGPSIPGGGRGSGPLPKTLPRHLSSPPSPPSPQSTAITTSSLRNAWRQILGSLHPFPLGFSGVFLWAVALPPNPRFHCDHREPA